MKRFVSVTIATVFATVALPAVVSTQGDKDKIEAGKKVYAAQKCSTCHSVAGTGSKMAPLDGVGSKLTAAEIKAWITNPDPLTEKLATKPKIKMKKYTLPDAELEALVAYVASLKK
jgi:mono/diheme cytochrome c family protein